MIVQDCKGIWLCNSSYCLETCAAERERARALNIWLERQLIKSSLYRSRNFSRFKISRRKWNFCHIYSLYETSRSVWGICAPEFLQTEICFVAAGRGETQFQRGFLIQGLIKKCIFSSPSMVFYCICAKNWVWVATDYLIRILNNNYFVCGALIQFALFAALKSWMQAHLTHLCVPTWIKEYCHSVDVRDTHWRIIATWILFLNMLFLPSSPWHKQRNDGATFSPSVSTRVFVKFIIKCVNLHLVFNL